jgi:hypothetical protein
MTIFIKPGLLVHDRQRPMPRGVAIVVGPAAAEGRWKICRWRGASQHWSLPAVVGQEQLEAVVDWTAVPLTEAKRIAAAAYERNYLVRAMESANGSVVDAARLARVDRSNFRRLLARHGLTAKVPRSAKPPRRRKRRARR